MSYNFIVRDGKIWSSGGQLVVAATKTNEEIMAAIIEYMQLHNPELTPENIRAGVTLLGVEGSLEAPTPSTPVEWIRPSDWLNFPALADEDEQVMHGLFAVFNSDGNYVAFTAAGNFTVDWGDGVVENVNSGVRAQHEYSYAGLSNDTLTSEGFKQAIIKVTPQAGQNLTSITLAGGVVTVVHSALLNAGAYSYGWLDIRVNAPSLTALVVGASTNRQTRMMKRFELIKNNVTNMSYMFSQCYSLVSLPLLNTANVTNMSYMFNNCYSLTSLPLFNTANVTNMSYMFYYCYSLTSVPLFNTANVTDMSSMFNNCRALTSVPLFDTSKVMNMSSMFNVCYSLTSVPLFNTINVANMSGMFNYCFALTSVPLFNTANVTNMSSMFNQCFALVSLPLFDTANVTNMSSMFNQCFALASVPLFNTVKVTIMSYMFNNCYSLTSVPLFDTSKVTDMNTMFGYCFALTSVPLFNTIKVTIMSFMLRDCSSLTSVPAFNVSAITSFDDMRILTPTAVTSNQNSTNGIKRIQLTGGKYGINISNCMLSAAALNEFFNNLGTAAGAQSIRITNNPGAATCNASLAEAKGYTILN